MLKSIDAERKRLAMLERQIEGKQRTQQLAWLWRFTIVVCASIWPHVAYSADGHRGLKMYIGIVKTSDVCPTGYTESRCAVDRTPDEHKRLLDNLQNTKDFHEYTLTSSQTVSELVLPEWMIGALGNVIEVGSRVSEHHSAVFIFDLDHTFQSIVFTIDFPDRGLDVNKGRVAAVRRWYHHCQAGCVAPTNHVTWKVVADEIHVEFKFVSQQ